MKTPCTLVVEYHERLTWQGVVPLIKLLVGFSKQSLLWLQSNTLLDYVKYYWLLIIDNVLVEYIKFYWLLILFWFLKTKLIVTADKHSPRTINYCHSLQVWMVFTSNYLQVLWTCRIQSQSALLCVNWLKLPHISYRMTTAHSMTLYSLRKIHKSITMISWGLQSSIKAMMKGKMGPKKIHVRRPLHMSH